MSPSVTISDLREFQLSPEASRLVEVDPSNISRSSVNESGRQKHPLRIWGGTITRLMHSVSVTGEINDVDICVDKSNHRARSVHLDGALQCYCSSPQAECLQGCSKCQLGQVCLTDRPSAFVWPCRIFSLPIFLQNSRSERASVLAQKSPIEVGHFPQVLVVYL